MDNLSNEQPNSEPQEQVESAPEPAKPVLSEKMLANMRRESAVQREKLQKKERDRVLEEAQQVMSLIKTDPKRALALAGVSIDEIESLGAKDSSDPLAELRSELMHVKEELERRNRTEENQRSSKEREEVLAMVGDFVKENSDKYQGLSHVPNAASLVEQRILQAYEKDETILSEHDAAQMVENELRGLYEMLGEAYGGDIPNVGNVTKPESFTLTNKLSADRTGRAKVNYADESADDTRARRLAMIEKYFS